MNQWPIPDEGCLHPIYQSGTRKEVKKACDALMAALGGVEEPDENRVMRRGDLLFLEAAYEDLDDSYERLKLHVDVIDDGATRDIKSLRSSVSVLEVVCGVQTAVMTFLVVVALLR